MIGRVLTTKAKIAGLKSVPFVLYTTKEDIARRKVMVVHMSGNALGGGCQEGRSLFLNTGSSLLAIGLEFFRGENNLERILRKNMTTPTSTSAFNPVMPFNTLICKTCKAVRIAVYWKPVAKT